MKPEVVVDVRSKLGECPLWHPFEKKLYWVDICGKTIYCYDPKHKVVKKVHSGDTVGGYTIQADGSLLMFMKDGAIKILKKGVVTTLIERISKLEGSRFNDVIADPSGRVFCGTMPDKSGEAYLYLLDTNGKLILICDKIGLSNGMGFTLNEKQMYFTDSKKKKIYIFDYDIKNGFLSNRKVFLDIVGDVEPDGLTVDAEGYVWSAFWNGGCIKRFTPHGKESLTISFPTSKITSLTFAGLDYKDIYVTSAIGEDFQNKEEYAGALFRLKLNIQGKPEYLSKICI